MLIIANKTYLAIRPMIKDSLVSNFYKLACYNSNTGRYLICKRGYIQYYLSVTELMTPGQHFIISWVVANSKELDRRSRVFITLSGLLPDLDGIGYIIDKFGLAFGYNANLYEGYHHVLGHNLVAGLLMSFLFARYSNQRLTVFWLCLFAFHLHLVCDLAGSMGPDGYQWPIFYFYPFLPDYEVTWAGQWELSSWINSMIGIIFFLIAIYLARYRKVTFFEFFSKHFEDRVVKIATQKGFFKMN